MRKVPCGTASPRERTQKQTKREQRSSAPKTQFNVRKSNEEQLPFDFLLVDSTRGPTRCVAFVALFKAFLSDLCFIFKVLSLVRYCVVKITVFSLCLLTPLQEVAIWARILT